MDEFQLRIPVALMIFNRPDTTREVFEAVRAARPPRLYLVSDAAREGRPEEEAKVREARSYVETHIDWPCALHKNYAERNMGCKRRMATGITWVFSQEEIAIILEDDCVPKPEFFRFEQEMLLRYKENENVFLVSGTNNLPGFPIEGDYTFSRFASIWGWGSYARAWRFYDVEMKRWERMRGERRVKKLFSFPEYLLFQRDADRTGAGLVDTWDMQWLLTVIDRGFGVVPAGNLIRNIGCGREDATHTKDTSREISAYGEMRFPLRHTEQTTINEAYDRAYCRTYYGAKRFWNACLRAIGR